MKNFIIISLSILLLCACNKKQKSEKSIQSNHQEIEISKIITDEQYASLTKDEQKLTDYINAGIAGIRGLNMSKDNKYADYESIVSVSLEGDAILSNHVIVSKMEKEIQTKTTTARAASHGSCHVCGIGSAYDCIKKVKKYMQEEHTTEIDVHIKLSGTCVDITYCSFLLKSIFYEKNSHYRSSRHRKPNAI